MDDCGKRKGEATRSRKSAKKKCTTAKLPKAPKTSHSDPDSAGTGNDVRASCLGPSTSATAYSTFESEPTHYHVDLWSDDAIDEGSPFASNGTVYARHYI